MPRSREPKSGNSGRLSRRTLAWCITTVVCVAILSVIFFLAWRETQGSDAVWGSLGEWAGAFGAFAAALVAVTIAIRDGRQREADRRYEQAAQARLVTATIERDPYRVVVTNHSPAPIFRVRVQAIHAPESYDASVVFKKREWSVIPPGETGIAFFARQLQGETRKESQDGLLSVDITAFAADIRFVDAEGLDWGRRASEPPRYGDHARSEVPPTYRALAEQGPAKPPPPPRKLRG